MDAVLSLLISAGIIAFGIWIVASTITAGWGWTLKRMELQRAGYNSKPRSPAALATCA